MKDTALRVGFVPLLDSGVEVLYLDATGEWETEVA